VAAWLEKHMLAHPDAGVPEKERPARARCTAEYFGSDEAYDRFRTHGRPIRIEELHEKLPWLRVTPLEANDPLQDAVLSLYHALDHTFGGPAIKIVENHLGARHVRAAQTITIPFPLQAGQPPQPGQPPSAPQRPLPQAPGVPQTPQPNRAERRRQERARKH